MKCPHCAVVIAPIRANPIDLRVHNTYARVGQISEFLDPNYRFRVHWESCPNCLRFVIYLQQWPQGKELSAENATVRVVYPKSSNRPLSSEIPKKLREDFQEACLVLSDSPKASAALSRRCLQRLLREHLSVPHNLDLRDGIEWMIENKNVPVYIAELCDPIRTFGNFAAHPNTVHATGEIIDVDPGEAEWCLDLLENLFEFIFVLPKRAQEKRDTLNEKLKQAGKPLLKNRSDSNDKPNTAKH